MLKLVIGILILSMIGGIFNFINEGGQVGYTSTRLAASMSDSQNYMIVASADGFEDHGTIMIDNEEIEYSNIENHEAVGTETGMEVLTGCVRSANGTDAETHNAGAIVYDDKSGSLNKALGFDFIKVDSTFGISSLYEIPYGLVTKTLPKALSWNYSYLDGEFTQYLRLILSLFSIAAMFYVAIMLIQSVGNMFQGGMRIFGG